MVDMARVVGEIVIYRPVVEVFDFVADERNEPRYKPRLRDVEQISEGSIGSGTRFRTELETMDRTMPMIVEFGGYERPRRLASVTRSSMMGTEGALTFESVPRWHPDALVVGCAAARCAQADRASRRRDRPPAGATHMGQPQATR